jgi:integrase
MAKLTTVTVKSAKPGRHADGQGLYLMVKDTGARSWLLRVQVGGRRRDIGLGSVDLTARTITPDGPHIPILLRKCLTLAEARDKSHLLRQMAKAGLDPIAERDKEKRWAPTFKEAAIACHTAMKGGWVDKHGDAWLASMEAHVFPSMGSTLANQVEAATIRDTLLPIWTTKPVIARKVRQRITTVLDYSKGEGWRATEAPTRSLSSLLGRQARGGNFAAMDYRACPAFVATVSDEAETIGRLALLFTILTVGRSGETRTARWSHVDIAAKLWNRPAGLMKNRLPHSVTLNDTAMAILERAGKHRTTTADCLIFPGRGGFAISDMTMTKILRDAGITCAVHGFRSSFRDWAAEQMPHVPEAVAEAALAHQVPSAVERAYRRAKFLDMRRQLLDAWGEYLLPSAGSNVIRLAAANG